MNVAINRMFVFTLMCLALVLSGCDNDDDLSNQDPVAGAALKIQGQWSVTSYVKEGSNQTSVFQNHFFTFQSNGSILVTKSGSQVSSGTWKVIQDGGQLKLDLVLSGGSYFQEITEDWEIVSTSSGSLSLKNVSGGNGGTDLLVFGR